MPRPFLLQVSERKEALSFLGPTGSVLPVAGFAVWQRLLAGHGPGLVIVGHVVSLADECNWYQATAGRTAKAKQKQTVMAG